MSESSQRIRILAVDDHPLMREGIIGIISSQPDLELVGEAATGREAVLQFRTVQPDVTLMDLQMPDMSGIDAICTIRASYPDARIIVLTTYGGDVLAQRALRAGARAYVLKSQVRNDLPDLIRAVHAGHKRVQAEVAESMARHMTDSALTQREVEVLRLIAQGNSNKSVGAALSINEDTVKGHVKNILAKLDAKDRTHAVTIGTQRGILEPL